MTSASAICPTSSAPSTGRPASRQPSSVRPRRGAQDSPRAACAQLTRFVSGARRLRRALEMETTMYDHIGLRVADLVTATRFYTHVLAPPGDVFGARGAR